jgi:CAAX prenyl protease-like protein
MTAMPQPNASQTAQHEGPDRPWQACVVPFVVFLAGGLLEPTRSGDGLAGALGIPFAAYPLLYSLRIAATLFALARSWTPIRLWVGRPTWWPPLVGLTLFVPWVALASLQRDAGWAAGLGERPAFNPFADCNESAVPVWAFVAIRAIGLIAVVPLVEELFLRGFLMRYVINEDFWNVPFGMLTFSAAAACLLYAAASHPAECVAAAGWFAVVTGIAAATRRPIDTILAHAATNLALGAYVLLTANWWLL